MHRGDALLLFKELCDGRPCNIPRTFKSSSSSRFSSLRQQHSFYVVDEKESSLPLKRRSFLKPICLTDQRWNRIAPSRAFQRLLLKSNNSWILLQREQSDSRINLSCGRKSIRPLFPFASWASQRIRLYGAKEGLEWYNLSWQSSRVSLTHAWFETSVPDLCPAVIPSVSLYSFNSWSSFLLLKYYHFFESLCVTVIPFSISLSLFLPHFRLCSKSCGGAHPLSYYYTIYDDMQNDEFRIGILRVSFIVLLHELLGKQKINKNSCRYSWLHNVNAIHGLLATAINNSSKGIGKHGKWKGRINQNPWLKESANKGKKRFHPKSL